MNEDDDNSNILNLSSEKNDEELKITEQEIELKDLSENEYGRAKFLDEELDLNIGENVVNSHEFLWIKDLTKRYIELAYDINNSERQKAISNWKKVYGDLFYKDKMKEMYI